MSDRTPDESPDAQLAGRIARRLVAEGLVAAADEAALGDALAAGQPSKAQWLAWAEGGDAAGGAAHDGGVARG